MCAVTPKQQSFALAFGTSLQYAFIMKTNDNHENRSRSVKKAFSAKNPKEKSAQEPKQAQAREDGKVRLNKALADAGLCSRRKADELIQRGLVCVNGQAVSGLGERIDPNTDKVTVDGKAIALRSSSPSSGTSSSGVSSSNDLVYLLLHKPTHVLCTVKDPEGRATVMDLIPKEFSGKRLYPVGRLDFMSEGLVILTNDGDFAHRLSHPSFEIERVYRVHIRGEVPESALETMRRGMVLSEGEALAPVLVKRLALPRGKSGSYVELVLRQGINRQIRRMCRDLGLVILSLCRVRHGEYALGDLAPRQVKVLKNVRFKKQYFST